MYNKLFPKNLLDSLPGNFAVTSPELEVVFVSAGYRKFLGAGKEVLVEGFLPKLLSKIFPDYSSQLHKLGHKTNNSIAEGSVFVVSNNADTMHNIELTWTPVLDEGEITYLVHSFKNLTQQEPILQNNVRVEEALQTMPGFAWISDETGNITSLSRDCPKNTELTIEQVQQGEWMKWVHPEEEKLVQELWQNLRFHQSTGEAIFRLKPNDAENYRWYLSRSAPITDAAGNLTGFIGLCTDVEKLKQSELGLKEEGNRLHKMLDALPYMAWAADPNGSYTYYNKKWWSFFETSDESWTVEKWAELMHPEEQEKVVTAWDQSLTTGTAYSINMRWRAHPFAEYRWFNVYAVPVMNADGNVSYWMGSTVDIHEQETAKAKLQATNRQLEESLQQFRYLAEMVPWTCNKKADKRLSGKRYTI